MQQSSNFSLPRFARLTLNDLLANKRSLLAASLAVFIFWSAYRPLFLLQALGIGSLPGRASSFPEHLFLFGFALFLSGFILTGRSFRQMHRSELAYHYLTLPCSNLERLLSKWLITSVGYALALVGLFFVHTVILEFVLSTNVPFSFFDSSLWIIIACYLGLHSFILLGAAFFKRYNLVKTLLAALLVGYLYVIPKAICVFALPLLLSPESEKFKSVNDGVMIGFWIAMVPVFWFLTYLRVKKYEIN